MTNQTDAEIYDLLSFMLVIRNEIDGGPKAKSKIRIWQDALVYMIDFHLRKHNFID